MPDSSAQNNTRVANRDANGSGPAPTPLPPGTPTKIGRFEIRAVLGEGAFGRVYRGFDAELRREVAIKVPHTAGLNDEFRERFLREARAIAAIHHPNVCPVYEVGTDGAVPYIVMRFVAGTTLANVIDNLKTPMPVRNAVMILRKLALGMAAAHAEGVTHRDLKPANVLFETATREVYITDFGLARMGGEANLTARDSFLGTPAYTSPEQANRKAEQVGPLSDVYSLGVILYEMLTGDVPFNGSVMEVAIAHCLTAPTPPSQVRPGLDPQLDAFVLKAMAKKPADRYPSAKAFADALTDYLRGDQSGGQSGSVGEMPAIALGGGREPEQATETVAEKQAGRRTAPAFEVVSPPPPVVVELDEEEEAEAPKDARRSGARKSAKLSKAGKKKRRREEEQASPFAALLKNKVALAGAALSVVALVLFVVWMRNKSEPETVQKPAPTPDPVVPPLQPQPQPKPQPKVEPKVTPTVDPKISSEDVRLRNMLLGRWRITTSITELMSAAELAKLKAEKGYVYLEFKSDGSGFLGVDSFDPLGRTALRKDFPPIPFKFRAVGTSQIEFAEVPRGGLQRFGPFVPGTQSTVRINDDTLTLSSATTTKLLRVVLN